MSELKQWKKSDYVTLALWFFPAAILTWGIHEFAHFGIGKLLGYDMFITFNTAGLASGSYANTWHQALVGLAGPMITWFQAIIAVIVINQRKQLFWYSFLFLPLYMRLVAMGISYTSKPNDEASVSLLYDLPMWVLPSISVVFLFALTYWGSEKLNVGWKGNLLSYLMASIIVTSIVVLDNLVF
ncbi:hypothetical protein [Thalassotalea ganghwensis]